MRTLRAPEAVVAAEIPVVNDTAPDAVPAPPLLIVMPPAEPVATETPVAIVKLPVLPVDVPVVNKILICTSFHKK